MKTDRSRLSSYNFGANGGGTGNGMKDNRSKTPVNGGAAESFYAFVP